jgi:hypothetical protein
MTTIETTSGTDLQLKARMQDACERIAKGIAFTREEKDQAAAEIDRIREANAKRIGIQSIAVDLVREMRNSQRSTLSTRPSRSRPS